MFFAKLFCAVNFILYLRTEMCKIFLLIKALANNEKILFCLSSVYLRELRPYEQMIMFSSISLISVTVCFAATVWLLFSKKCKMSCTRCMST